MILEIHQQQMIAHAVHFAVFDEAFGTPDEVALRAGLHALGDRWREVDGVQATAALTFLLSEDMAFSSPRLDGSTVRAVIDDFMGRFTKSVRFFTNGTWHMGRVRSKHSSTVFGPEWQPATDATFDGGVVAFDSQRAGLLWLEDED